MARDGVVHPDCPNASNPFHICSEYCPHGPSPRSNNIPDDKEIIVPNGVGIKENGVKMEEGRRRSVDPSCVNSSNPFHQCADYCVRQSHDGKSPVKGPKIMENTQKPLPRTNMPANKEILVLNGVGGNENDEKVEEGRRRSVDPSCVNASNPFHQCADYCVRRSHDEKSSLKGSKFGGTKEKVVIAENRKVNPSCPNASNPFHQCAEYCSKRSVGVDQHKRGNAGESTSKRGLIVAQRKDVNPGCVNASNPFHKCTEHCSQTRKN